MSRRRARELALQALYGIDQVTQSPKDILASLWDTQIAEDADNLMGKTADAEEIEYASRIVSGVTERLDELDGMIESASTNWRVARMPVVDRNILRLASYELVACHDVPASVSINEAVELAKLYGEKDSRAFVNGILDRIAAETGRGGRRHRARR